MERALGTSTPPPVAISAAAISAATSDAEPPDLAAMTSVKDIFDWAFVKPAAQAAVAEALDLDVNEPPRSLACIRGPAFAAVLDELKVDGVAPRPALRAKLELAWSVALKVAGSVPSNAAEEEKKKKHEAALRDKPELEKQKVAILKCQAEKPTAATTATSSTLPSGVTAGNTIAVSEVLDQLSSAIAPLLTQDEFRATGRVYFDKMEGKCPKTEEPTIEQLSALKWMIKISHGYADMAIWGPHGNRIRRKLLLSGLIPIAAGVFARVELKGPPDYETWCLCFRLLRSALIHLDEAGLNALDKYAMKVAELHRLFGSKTWHLLYQADVRMRNEEFPRIRREIDDERDAITKNGGTPGRREGQ